MVLEDVITGAAVRATTARIKLAGVAEELLILLRIATDAASACAKAPPADEAYRRRVADEARARAHAAVQLANEITTLAACAADAAVAAADAAIRATSVPAT
jgi:hypothetical protein